MIGSAADIAAAVRSGRTTATEVVETHLAAIDRLEPQLNAFTLVTGDAARAAAGQIDERCRNGEALGPLAGVPIGVKDLIDQAGTPNTRGTSGPPAMPDMNAPCVDRLLAADAVVVGRTGLHEFAYGFSSENPWFGPVRNPWDPATSPGGSSGGSGAAVAAQLVPVALGTDTGGSVRVPAALCRIVGLKVTHGRIPLTGVYPLVPSVDTVGPLTRTVADARLMYRVMAGFDAVDPWSVPVEVTIGGAGVALDEITVGIPRPWVDDELSDDVATGWSWFVDAVRDCGVTVIDLDLPDLDFPGLIIEALAAEVASVHRERFATQPDSYGPEVRQRLESTFDTSIDDYLRGLEWRARLRRSLRIAFSRCDALITPTVAAMRKEIGVDTIEIAGRPVPYRLPLSRFTAPVNHALAPALSLPLGGHVAAAQLVGPMWSEARLLDIAEALETRNIVSTPTPPLAGRDDSA